MDVQSLIEFFVYLSTIILLFYFKPFWSETAKKLVEKNNVEIITKISEQVKADINSETEKLKNYLSYSSQHSLNLLIDEKKALYDLNISIERTLKKFGSYASDFYNIIENYEKCNLSINEQYKDYSEKLSHLYLFIRDDLELMKLIREYSLELHNLKVISNKFILDNFYVKQIKKVDESNAEYFSIKFNEIRILTDQKYYDLSQKHDVIRDKIYARLLIMKRKFE